MTLSPQMARAHASMWQEERARADAAEAQTKDLIAALYRLWIRTAVGTEAQRVDAMTAAGDLLARVGALDAKVAHPEPTGG